MFSSPNSFSMTAIFWPCASVSTRLSRVVLPEPRKPVRMVAGMRAMGMACLANARRSWATMGGGDFGSRYQMCQAKPVPAATAIRLSLAAPVLSPRACAMSDPHPARPPRSGERPAPPAAERRTLFQQAGRVRLAGPRFARRADRHAGRRRAPRADRARVAHDARGRDAHGRHDRRRRDGGRAAHGPARHRRAYDDAAARRHRHRPLALPGLRGRARQRHRHPDGQGPAQAAALARPEPAHAAAPGGVRARVARA